MATQSFTISQLDQLPQGYTLNGSELLLNTVLSGSVLRSVKTSLYQLSSYYVTQFQRDDDQRAGGNIIAYGTLYLNGDTRERIYSMHTQDANDIRGTLALDDQGVSYDKYMHSGGIYNDTKNKKIYFPRGTWPRRHCKPSVGSSDKESWTWRELGGEGEAICRVDYDGTNFEVVKDLDAAMSATTDPTQYYDPCAVVYDTVHDYIFFACRCDHDESRIYRMDSDGSNLVEWVKMKTNNVNIDCLDIAHIPQDFFAVNNPSCTTTYLYFGISPDYDKTTNTSKVSQAAILRVPVIGNAPGALDDDYVAKYCIHKWWHSGYLDPSESTTTSPTMETTGIKGIKVFVSSLATNPADPTWVTSTRQFETGYGTFGKPGNPSKQWEVTMSKENVARDRSRIYVVHSGARNVKRDRTIITQTNTQTPGTPPMPDLPGAHTVTPELQGWGFGGNGVFELLIGEPAGGNHSFSANDDANRPYRTWLEAECQVSGSNKQLSFSLSNDSPGEDTTATGGGVGTGRGNNFAPSDYLYISTSPSQPSFHNLGSGSLDERSGRGLTRISTVNSKTLLTLDGTDATYDGPGEIGKVAILPVILNGHIDISGTLGEIGPNGIDHPFVGGAQFGLQQVAINPCTMEIFVSDFFNSAYYLIDSQSSSSGAAKVPGITGNPAIPSIPANPSNPVIPGNPTIPMIPGNAQIPGNPAIPAGPYNPYVPGNPTIPSTPSTPAIPGTSPTPGNPGNPFVPGTPGNAPVPAIPAGQGQSIRVTQPDDSYFGMIWRADAFSYCRGRNGMPLFNRWEHIGYNRPCGITGYNTGPWNDFRLVYTNGETQLLSDTPLVADDLNPGMGDLREVLAARGRELNGLSQVFTRHHVLPGGKNIWSIYDFGKGTDNGILVTLENKANNADYSVITQSTNGDVLIVPTLHYQNPTGGNVGGGNYPGTDLPGAVGTVYLQDDAALYQAKNSKQFRICYPDKISPFNPAAYGTDHFGLGGIDYSDSSRFPDNRSVNTIFFAVIQ